MVGLVGLELALGIGALVVVPYHRPGAWVPARGDVLYLVHAALGGLLGLGSVAVLLASRRAPRLARVGAVGGLVGVLLAAAGGLASVGQSTRLLGVGVMLVGGLAAGFFYLLLLAPVPSPAESPDGHGDGRR
jgi:hypothetical protein